MGIKFGTRTEYVVEYMEQIRAQYIKLTSINPETIIRGKGHRKTAEQRYYDKLNEYTEKLKTYSEHIKICGEDRNSYSKTDHDATFMRMKEDAMGNGQLKAAAHQQHAALLKAHVKAHDQARALGGSLIVAVNSDSSVKMLGKGDTGTKSELDRKNAEKIRQEGMI